jgi:uncharacterized protein (DUF924 family)
MSPATKDVRDIINSDLLASVRSFWFSHIPDQDAAVLPGREHMKPWFFGDEQFDQGCVYVPLICSDGHGDTPTDKHAAISKHFAEATEAIRSLDPSTDTILAALDGASPNDWLAAVLLLDQVPRNCYRGADAHIVFNLFDPLARAVTRRAIALGIPTSPDMKYFGCRRMWFYLPLMHSEELDAHDQAVAEYKEMGADFKALLAQPSAATSEQDRRCGEVLAANKEAAEKFLQTNLEFEVKHRDIIAKFGRYPHRNGPLGREMRPEERDYLDGGGETFGAAV